MKVHIHKQKELHNNIKMSDNINTQSDGCREDQAILLVCLNNAGVKAFERGDLNKSLRLFSRAVHAVMATLNIDFPASSNRMSKKMTRKVVSSQRKSFRPNASFAVKESRILGKRRRNNKNEEQPTQSQTPSSTGSTTYTYAKVFRIKASNSDPILDQTSPEQLTGIVLLNLAICHHLLDNKPGTTATAQCYYELAISAASLSGDLLPQVVIWNNLLQLHYDASNVDTALKCMRRLEVKITEAIDRGLLRKLKKVDRRGFLLNVMLFTNSAAAAA
jgi:hypothetical protein